MKLYSILLFAILAACVKPVHIPPKLDEEINNSIKPVIQFSGDSLTATITTNHKLSELDSLTQLAKHPVSINRLVDLTQPGIHDSSKVMYHDLIKNEIPDQKLGRAISSLQANDDFIVVTYSIDTSFVMPHIRSVFEKMNSTQPIEPLFDRAGRIPDFTLISPTISLMLPCDGQPIPTKGSRLPNAPRDYRSGVHRGIDFFSNWGTPVKSVADGIIIRSDLNYKEVPADFRIEILNRAAKLKRTPSDIFNSILLGKAVFIDHGFDLFPGYRSITIYAHLSYINSNIKPGYKIKAGEVFAKSGNTGTRPSTLGTRDESHLHWELILQNKNGEYYFGQNLPYKKLYPTLRSIFED
ncbi:MAG: M23 family metallopeptidase [Candidatus Marinimicrobia bacterium]|nr:M23 family metallopeptidase [Candidatus Neomarinimicrobiota bacterium]MBT4067790.1 M23 family metallopeptidase [Candidatus Neomarinimicrobiota bacterium]MBT4808467.1 M23 family metallopeptidase [Candidatus Neomarinimicrobiota bacterium]MBT5176617.1 M23 family metallopeptidase [Candidatus Neomarinimicrobiota bacterium]MBT6417990.1 M23 family metallopeptidase [Candidatus Neomarinimicrobiota bacterium]